MAKRERKNGVRENMDGSENRKRLNGDAGEITINVTMSKDRVSMTLGLILCTFLFDTLAMFRTSHSHKNGARM